MARSSAAGLNAPSGPRLRFHSTCAAPGIAPPRLARTSVPVVLLIAPRVENDRSVAAETVLDFAPGRETIRAWRAGPRTLGRGRGLSRHWQARLDPRAETAVEHLRVLVPEVFEEPERAGGAHTRLLVVDDHRRLGIDAAQIEEVIDDPHERFQGARVGIDERQTPQVEMHRTGHVAGGVVLSWTQIDHKRPGRAAEGRLQRRRGGQQMSVWVRVHR